MRASPPLTAFRCPDQVAPALRREAPAPIHRGLSLPMVSSSAEVDQQLKVAFSVPTATADSTAIRYYIYRVILEESRMCAMAAAAVQILKASTRTCNGLAFEHI